MYGKNMSNSSMSHSEVMRCKYFIMDNNYIFMMEMEAIEEGILGDYKIVVACDVINGSMSLLQKRLLDTAPTGKIAMMLPQLISLKDDYKAYKALKKDIEIKLERAHESMKKGKDNQKVAAKLTNLEKQHKAIKGKCDMLYHEIESQIPKGWSKRSDPRDIVSSNPSRGLIAKGSGYDYYVCSPGSTRRNWQGIGCMCLESLQEK